MLVDLNQMETDFKTLFELLQTNSKRESIFYTSPEEIRLTKFCQQEVKPILHKLHLNFEIFQKRFLKDIKEMKDVFDSIENDLSASWKQNEPLNDQLLEAKLKHEIECCVLLRLRVASSVRRPLNRDSQVKNSVLFNTKKTSKKVEVYVRKNRNIDIASENVVSNKENVIDDDVKNAFKAKDVFQIVLWIVDSGCSKHMTGDQSLLNNFVEKFMGTVRFGNDHFVAITGYGDYVQGNINVCHVYYVEGLGHNLFSVEQFCDGDLEVAFHSKTCYVRNLKGDDLLIGDRETNLYTISISDMAASSPVCLMSKATLTKSWLWHHRLSHLNFGTINDLTKHDLVDCLPKFKYGKDHLCIMQQFSTARTPQQNGVVERRNRTLVEAARKMFIFSRLPEFLWAEAISTACCTQNRSIIQTRHNKTPYELLRGRKPNVEYFYVFGSLSYPTNDRDDLGKMKPKADIRIFIGYSETSRGFRIYNRRTKKIMETIHVKFDELTAMASKHDSLEPIFHRFINDDSSAESMNIPSKEDLDNFSAAQQVHNHEDSHSTSSIIVEDHEAPPIVTTSEEQTSPISLNKAKEFNQEDSSDFDGNTVFVPYDAPNFEEAESSTTALDPSNMHEFHQVQPSTHI
ncbi:retrovirus-related pol polyprotein from transposon TNT 1-94 [Tanacetum coccineum]